MSLQHAAHYLASRGRGPDDSLVHMTRREVQSLQDIARAHGGSLSINPDTGLVEAGFLKNLLPMIAGAGITALTGGAAAPWMIGLGVGGVQAARTGSLEKGLMAGLGAYGGAGLMGAGQAAAGAVDHMGAQSAAAAGDATAGIRNLPITEQLKGAYAGLGTEAGRGAALNSLGGGFGAAKTAGMALAPALMDSGDQGPQPSDDERYNYSFDPGRVTDPNAGYTGAATGERTYFRPSYTRLPNTKGFNEGGIAHFDEGGDTSDVPPYKPNTALLQGAAAMNNVRPFTGNVPFAQPASSPAQVGSIQPTTSNPFYTMTGESGDAYRYLMGLGPTSAATNPVIATKPNITTQPTGDVGGGGGGGGGGGASPIMGGASVGNVTAPVMPSPDDDFPPTYVQPVPSPDDDLSPTEPMPPDPYPYPEPEPQPEPVLPWEPPVFNEPVTPEPVMPAPVEPEPVLPWEPPPYEPEPDPNFFEPGYGNTGVPEPAPYQGDPYTEPYVPYQGDPYTEPYVPEPEPYVPEPEPYVPEPEPYAPREAEPAPYVPEPEPYAPREAEPAPYVPEPYYEEPYYEDPFAEEFPPEEFPAEAYEDYFTGGEREQADDFGKYGLGVSEFGGKGFSREPEDMGYYFDGAANGGLMAAHQYAMGGSTLGGYSDGGRLLRGPGDGVSDSIPASIGRHRQPARLADGEFVVPARIVSELGNGSTEAGARKLYAMMDRIQAGRKRSIGKGNVAKNTRADRYLPA